MTDLTVVSLFDGIGGFPLAFQRAGARTVATVEIDKAAAAVSARHFPNATHFDDVTKVTGDDLKATGFVPDRGIITAGWPCQDLSVAGRRAGLEGARSGLWWEVVRILDETRSRWFVGENVPGLLSSNSGRDMGAVVGALADLGYGFAYRVLDAQWFGVPQRRHRVFIVGHLGEPFTAAAEILFECESGAGDSASGDQAGPGVAGAVAAGIGTASQPVTHTHTQRSQRFRAAGNAATGSTPNRQRVGTSSSVVAALTSNGVGTCGADDNQAQAGHLVVNSITTSMERNDDNMVGGGHLIVSDDKKPIVRRLTELECERLQGYPDGWTDNESGSARYRQLGNSVAVPVVEWIARRLVAIDEEIA